MKMSRLNKILLFISFSFSWELTLYIQDTEDEAADDYLILGMCENCHDDFHYGEDGYDIPTGVTPYTDIQFFNLDWLGSIDSNNNQCESPEFAVDLKSIHSPSELAEWKIRGATVGHDSPLEFTWEMDDISNDYEIYMYIGQNGYNLRELENITLESEDLNPIYENINGEWISYDNIKILIGGCASTGMTTYYLDEDQDGWGSGVGYDYCPGFQPNNFSDNNLDYNDSIYCINNIFDDCNICNGENQDMDCAGTCFGDAIIDDCNICNGENQTCLDIIFSHMPYNVYALIESNSIRLSWDFDLILDETYIQGFNIYQGYNENSLELIHSTNQLLFNSSDYNEGIFCVSIFDSYNNESDLVCTIASEYHSFFYNLHEGANLLSFPYIPENNSIDNVFNSISGQLDGIIGEGSAAYFNENINQWVGSLDDISYSKGYWIKIDSDIIAEEIELNVIGFPYQESIISYDLHEGYNLISYIGENNLPIEDAIPNQFSNNITSIIGEGVASVYSPELQQWLGNLNELKFGSGYWIETNAPINFYWESSQPNNFILKNNY